MIADTLEALISLAQMNVLEIHTWNSTIDRVETPDRIVLDLDPRPLAARHPGGQTRADDPLKTPVEQLDQDDGRARASRRHPDRPGTGLVQCLEFARAVSMPIAWADLEPSFDPARVTVETLKAYLARRRADPWRDYWRSRQRLQLLA